MQRSLQVSLTAILAALHAVLYFISFGLWRNWGIYLESVEGIILGPKFGFLAALLGSVIARMIKPDSFWMFGMIAEPLSVLIAGFLAETKWKPGLVIYGVMLSAYFIHPFGRILPLWTILDILFALLLIYPAAKFSDNLLKKDVKRLSVSLVLISFVCIATDSLARVFLLVPCGLHELFFNGLEELYLVFVGAAVDSYIEDCIAVIIAFFVCTPLLISISRLGILKKARRHARKDLVDES